MKLGDVFTYDYSTKLIPTSTGSVVVLYISDINDYIFITRNITLNLIQNWSIEESEEYSLYTDIFRETGLPVEIFRELESIRKNI